MRLLFSIASILLATAWALAATITLSPQTPDRPNVVTVEGPVIAVDADEFAAKTASLHSAIVAVNSDGGTLMAGVRIGEAIRRKGFSTIVPDGRRCAAACALAWLGGAERFIGANASIGFHAAYDSASGEETGSGNAVIGTYLTKIGLPYEAIIYITQPAPNDTTWLNMSHVAQRGVRVTLLSSLAKETVVAIPTRYGNITVTRDEQGCCVGHISYRDQQVEILSVGPVYASLEGVFEVKEGDLVVISSPSGARGVPLRYYVLLVDQDHMTHLGGSDFGTADGTFKAIQRDDEVYFDLGFQEKKKKSAIYKNGTIAVAIRSTFRRGATLPRNECAAILNMVVTCVRLPACDEEGIFGAFAMASQRYFRRLEEMPVFTARNFYSVCTDICTTKSYVAKQTRSVLCGY
jgi:hypothetical protein